MNKGFLASLRNGDKPHLAVACEETKKVLVYPLKIENDMKLDKIVETYTPEEYKQFNFDCIGFGAGMVLGNVNTEQVVRKYCKYLVASVQELLSDIDDSNLIPAPENVGDMYKQWEYQNGRITGIKRLKYIRTTNDDEYGIMYVFEIVGEKNSHSNISDKAFKYVKSYENNPGNLLRYEIIPIK